MGDGDSTVTSKSQSRLCDHRPLALQPDQLREVMKLFPQAVVGSISAAFGAILSCSCSHSGFVRLY
jgi:hypothetical protein